MFFENQELLKVRESLQNAVGREPTESELAEATNMSVVDVKRHFAVGRAARNKLIKVSRELFSASQDRVLYVFLLCSVLMNFYELSMF